MKQFLPRSLWRSKSCRHHECNTPDLLNRKWMHLYCWSHKFVITCYNSNRQLIHYLHKHISFKAGFVCCCCFQSKILPPQIYSCPSLTLVFYPNIISQKGLPCLLPLNWHLRLPLLLFTFCSVHSTDHHMRISYLFLCLLSVSHTVTYRRADFILVTSTYPVLRIISENSSV